MLDVLPVVLAFVSLTALPAVRAQVSSSWPHAYPDMPKGDYSPAWQNYFEVTDPLPNVTWDLGRTFAGNIGVQRAGHPNNTLFFWAFEKENGSLTAGANEQSDVPWGIWLNGGPGASSLLGLLYENGPIHIHPNYSAYENNYSWNRLADYIWIDQPVGTGWATADEDGYVYDEDQMGTDFMGFLGNLVKVFPSLKTRPLYLTGESYSGTYIPYITKTYFSLSNPPVNLAKIAIGDGTVGSAATFEYLPTTTIIQTYPQLIGYDPAVFEWFREQEHLCGYDLNLTYPQDSHFADIQLVYPTDSGRANQVYMQKKTKRDSAWSKRGLWAEARARYGESNVRARHRSGHLRREQAKRDLAGRANGTIDPWYGCFIYDAVVEYALNYTFPWSVTGSFDGFDVYDIPDALNPEIPIDGSVFYNDNRTIAALHAPTSRPWVGEFDYPFLGGEDGEDPSVEPMAFLTELATNASMKNVQVILYSGNDDSLVSHRGTQVVIQNTTFGGIQGFTRKPSTPWYDDEGNFAGIVHQERGWSYLLFKGAGHLIAEQQPALAYVFLREFVLGNNQTGLVNTTDGQIVGGENSILAEDVMPGQSGIYVGSGATQSTYTFPSATIAAWQSYIATATATIVSVPNAPTARSLSPPIPTGK
ncbi:hypothetical protein AcW1_006420 [Taiwanofungus camphoratus]|nr:hypothetical protein AcW1_006420 [Antrodia cinnamomea]